MRWNRISRFAAALTLGVAVGTPSYAEPAVASAASVVTEVESAYKDVASLRADFVQTTRSASMGGEVKEKGRIFLEKPRKMRIEFSGQSDKLFLADGENLWIYTPADKQAIRMAEVSSGGSVGFDLQDLSSLDQHFTVELLDDPANKRAYVLELKPKAASQYQKVRLVFSRKRMVLERLVLFDAFGSETEMRFTNLKLNTPADSSLFVFEVPDGVTVIDGG